MDKLLIIATGGTIDKIYFDDKSDYQVGEPQIADTLKLMNVGFDFEIDALMRKDSLHLDDEDRARIREAALVSDCAHIIITHGTDTMVETAHALKGIPGKTIVLTGALAPARFADSDAMFNLGMAFAAVQTLSPGVYIAMNGRIFDAARVRKDRELNAFVDIS